MAKKISDMSPEEQEHQRAKWRDAQNKTRVTKKIAETPTHDEWVWNWDERFPEQHKQLNEYAKNFTKTVGEELAEHPKNLPTEQLDQIAWCLLSARKGWIREVIEPGGEIFGGLLSGDTIGSYLEQATRKFNLDKSETFLKAYKELLLSVLDKKYSQNADPNHADKVEREAAQAVQRELKRLSSGD